MNAPAMRNVRFVDYNLSVGIQTDACNYERHDLRQSSPPSLPLAHPPPMFSPPSKKRRGECNF